MRRVLIFLLIALMILISTAGLCGQHFLVAELPEETAAPVMEYVRGVNILRFSQPTAGSRPCPTK